MVEDGAQGFTDTQGTLLRGAGCPLTVPQALHPPAFSARSCQL